MRVSHAPSDFRASSHMSTSSYQPMRSQVANSGSNNYTRNTRQQAVNMATGPYIALQHSPRGAPSSTAQVLAPFAFAAPESQSLNPRSLTPKISIHEPSGTGAVCVCRPNAVLPSRCGWGEPEQPKSGDGCRRFKFWIKYGDD